MRVGLVKSWGGTLLLLVAWFQCAHTYIDFYVDSRQTEILYGVKTEGIFYIENGVVNQYAMTFQDQVRVQSWTSYWNYLQRC